MLRTCFAIVTMLFGRERRQSPQAVVMMRRISVFNIMLASILLSSYSTKAYVFKFPTKSLYRPSSTTIFESTAATSAPTESSTPTTPNKRRRTVAIIGGGWGGLSAAHTLAKDGGKHINVVLLEASPRVGGLVRDGFTTRSGQRPAEAGQHGFWNNYHNIYRLLFDELRLDRKKCLTDYAEQGQYSPQGLEAVWPVYQEQQLALPTGLAQAVYTRFLNLPIPDLLSAFPLVLAFSEFDNSEEAWKTYDETSFRDLCVKLGVSKRCYDEAFEPMILTGLFAPGSACSAAAALGMAYFFVLQSQNAFDVQWCRGNIGEVIFDPWIRSLEKAGVDIRTSARVVGFDIQEDTDKITTIKYDSNGNSKTLVVDDVVFGVGAKALSNFVRFCPEFAQYREFQSFSNLRGTSVLATRIFLNKRIEVPYSANACWGFDEGVGMTMFDISTIHNDNFEGTILEVDYYHANSLLVLSDEQLEAKVKSDVDKILGFQSKTAKVVDMAIVRLPEAVNWYFPGSHKSCPGVKSSDLSNVFFAGDLVKTDHGAWSQEKAFVTGRQAANMILKRDKDVGVLSAGEDEIHVRFGRTLVQQFQSIVSRSALPGPKLTDFFR